MRTNLFALVVLIQLATASAEDGIVHVVPTRKLAYLDMQFRQLMLDEYAVDRYSNVRKLSRPLLTCEGPHELESMSCGAIPSRFFCEPGYQSDVNDPRLPRHLKLLFRTEPRSYIPHSHGPISHGRVPGERRFDAVRSVRRGLLQ